MSRAENPSGYQRRYPLYIHRQSFSLSGESLYKFQRIEVPVKKRKRVDAMVQILIEHGATAAASLGLVHWILSIKQ